MGDQLPLILRVVHIFCGTFWVGAALMLAGFIEPAVAALGPEGGKFLQRMVGPGRFALFMMMAAVLTAASGLTMLWQGGGIASWLDSGYGKSIVVGSAVGLVGFVWGLAVNATAAARLSRIGREIQAASGPPLADKLAEIPRLQKRLHVGGIISAILLGFSVLAMAAARYM
jgi:putative copper export protein